MPGKVIAVVQQKGGSGKTTLVANLAVALVEPGHRVAVLDSDPQGSLGRWFMARADRMGDTGTGLTFGTASAWGVRYECGKLRGDHDFVLVDTPPKADVDLRPTVSISDLMLVPVAASHVDLWATQAVLDLADRDDTPVLIAMNRVNPRARLTGDVAAELGAMGAPVARAQLANRVIYAETLGNGQAVTERARSGPAAAEVLALAQEVLAAT